jgi:hypothetical protein
MIMEPKISRETTATYRRGTNRHTHVLTYSPAS